MKEHTCQLISEEELVAYTDGDLTPSEAERIAAHVATCPECRTITEALERSLQVTQAIWQTGQAQWPETRSFDRTISNGVPFRKAMCVAASILLILGAGAMWLLLSESSEPTRSVSEETKIAELRLKIADSADAARLLAAAELLNKYPEAKDSVERRYRYIVETFPETAAAAKAKLKTQQFK